MPVELRFTIQTNSAAPLSQTLRGSSHTGALRVDGDVLHFGLPTPQHTYLTSTGKTRFADPPQHTALPLEPAKTYALHGAVAATGDVAELTLIQYDARSQLAHVRVPLRDGPFALQFDASPAMESCLLALRICGAGRVRLSNLTLSEVDLSGEDWPLFRLKRGQFYDAALGHGHDPYDAPDVDGGLVLPAAAIGAGDTFDRTVAALPRQPALVPIAGLTDVGERAPTEGFRLDQLELLWQQGLLGGVSVDLGAPASPSPRALQWLQMRGLPVIWRLETVAQIDRLAQQVWPQLTGPSLLAPRADGNTTEALATRAMRSLDQYPHVYLLTALLTGTSALAQALARHAARLVFGDGGSAERRAVARRELNAFDLPSGALAGVRGDNLYSIYARYAEQRRQQLAAGTTLRFPRLPQTPADVANQGFEIIPVDQMAADEDDTAKDYWREHVASFYLKPKPWSWHVAMLAEALGAESVLEFGCHAGRNLAAIQQRLPHARLQGLDLNPAAIEAGRQRYGLDLRVGDEHSLAELSDGAFDFVFTVSVLDHIPQIDRLCDDLLRVTRRWACFIEVTLPVEGKVIRHFDHAEGRVRASTAASYSWDVARFIQEHPRVERLDRRPIYVHDASLGPYYVQYLATLTPAP